MTEGGTATPTTINQRAVVIKVRYMFNNNRLRAGQGTFKAPAGEEVK